MINNLTVEATALLEEIVDDVETGIEFNLIWERIEIHTLLDKELDLIVAILEEVEDFIPIAEFISCKIHTPTLASDFERSQPYFINDRCANADWQEPKTKEINYEKL